MTEAPPYAVAARRKDLSGLPPTWIAVSDIDLLFDEGRQYHERMLACGANSELFVIPRAPHGFEAFLPKSCLAKSLFQENYRFLRKQLGLSRAAN
jgi:acetyl esterase/lipase